MNKRMDFIEEPTENERKTIKISSLGTSGRETKGALGQLVLGDTNLKTAISLASAVKSGDTKLASQIAN
ncbi:MAG TPA: hypothetical protein ENH75_07330, partial [archaeon]|nr:hypothetical protein [archaeon]